MYESEGRERHGEVLCAEVVSLSKMSDGKRRSLSVQKRKRGGWSFRPIETSVKVE